MKNFIKIFAILLFLNFFLPQALAEEVLTWEACLKEAGINHPDLISAQAVIEQQKADKTITKSGLFPQISVDADVKRAKTSTTNSTTGITKDSTTDTYSYGITGTQLVFDALKSKNDVKAASENISAAQYSYKFTSSEVRLNLRIAFVNLLKAQELINVAQEIVKIRRDSLELITLRYHSGLEHRGALLTAEANLSEANFGLAQARRDIELFQRQLAKEMGRTEFKPVSVQSDFTINDTAKEKPDFEAMAKNNPSLLQLAAKKNAATFGVNAAYADFLPQVSGSAGASKTSSHWPPQNEQWNLGVNVSMPVFEGGLKTAELTKAKAVYSQAEADERSKKDTVVLGLQQSWVNLQDAIETVDVQAKSLEAAEERSKIAEAQYSTGFITFDSWIIIQNDLVNAKRAYLNARINVMLTEAGWIQAKGETIEYGQ